MAGDWLKFEKSTSDKPEVWSMAENLGIDPDAVIGKLLRVWAWFDEQSEDGNALSVSKLLLDRRVGVSGFCDSMIVCGWMTEEGREVHLPNFDRHNGKTAKNRSLTAKRVANHKAKSNDKTNDAGVSSALPREEKRREEKKDRGAAALDYSSWPESPDPQILADWKALRKSAKAPISQTVVSRFGSQLSKAKDLGFSVDDCLGKVIEKGWKGFNAEWMANDNSSSFGQPAKRTIRDFPQG